MIHNFAADGTPSSDVLYDYFKMLDGEASVAVRFHMPWSLIHRMRMTACTSVIQVKSNICHFSGLDSLYEM
jgi:hypothetical protein